MLRCILAERRKLIAHVFEAGDGRNEIFSRMQSVVEGKHRRSLGMGGYRGEEPF